MLSFTSEYMLVYIFIAAIALLVHYKWSFKYWKRKNSPFVDPSIPYGNGENPFTTKTYAGLHFKKLYDQLKSAGHEYGGIYVITTPGYLLASPQIIQCIMQRDFHYFVERGFYYNEKDDPLSANLFALGGEKWRRLRTKLSPAFTSGKMKMMSDNILKCACQMKNAVEESTRKGKAIDVKEIMACYTTDVIGSCAFGLECNSFTHPNAEFRRYGRAIFQFTSMVRVAVTIFAFAYPNLARRLGVKLFSKRCSDFFINMVRKTVQFRKDNNIIRKDMLQLLMEAEESNFTDKESKLRELAAQVFIFFAAGFETSSTTLTFCLFELALNASIQEKLRNEVDRILKDHEGKLTYEALMSMKYMDQVVDETLRKYPPVSYITRQCEENYVIPNTNIVLEKDVGVIIPVFGLHHDPDYYPEPDTFDPERFSEENKKKRLPFTFLPFGEGPRICIGARFGLMQIKVGLVVLLKHFRFSLSPKLAVPLKFEQYSFTLTPKSEVLLDVEKLET